MKKCQIAECEKAIVARGFCNVHYARLKRKNALGGVTRPQTKKGEVIKFLRQQMIAETDQCVPWPFAGAVDRGRLRFEGKMVSACRLICSWVYGNPENETLHAAHSCGNGHLGCVNPRHLRWATPQQNNADKVLHGTNLATVKLTNVQIAEIAADSRPHVEICRSYGITRQTIWRVKRGERKPNL